MKKLVAAPMLAAVLLAGCGSSHHHPHPTVTHVIIHHQHDPHSTVTHHVVKHHPKPLTQKVKSKVHSLTKKH